MSSAPITRTSRSSFERPIADKFDARPAADLGTAYLSGNMVTKPARRFRTLNSRNFHARVDELFAKNHLEANSPIDGFMFETFGAEVDFVREVLAKEPNRICTIVTVDSGAWYICRGWHYVNRIGYLVAKPGVKLPEFADFRY